MPRRLGSAVARRATGKVSEVDTAAIPLLLLDERRLWCDLLSSMPLCFNLMGPLWADPTLATGVDRPR
jgi:hypothetical protein